MSFQLIFDIKMIFLGQGNDFLEYLYFYFLFRITRRILLEKQNVAKVILTIYFIFEISLRNYIGFRLKYQDFRKFRGTF